MSCSIMDMMDKARWHELKGEFYDQDIIVQVRGGMIDFAPTSVSEIEGKPVTYDEFLEAQYASLGKQRYWFAVCSREALYCSFKGEVGRTAQKDKVCFQNIAVNGVYCDGTGFVGKENHVWMDANPFEQIAAKNGRSSLAKGDCFSFCAEPYRYLKTSNGKEIHYGIRNPYNIEQIEAYKQPTNEKLALQAVDRIICEDLCMFREQCYGLFCLMNEDSRNLKRAFLLEAYSHNEEEKDESSGI